METTRAASQHTGLQQRWSVTGYRASPPHQHQPGALQVLGVPVEAVSCKVHTYVMLLYGQEEKSTVL